MERITKNLAFFKDNEYQTLVSNINTEEMSSKYDLKMKKIKDEISKLDKIIRNGCGSIIEKSQSSRISTLGIVSGQKEISHIDINDTHLEPKEEEK